MFSRGRDDSDLFLDEIVKFQKSNKKEYRYRYIS